jgi:hypothetical protein
MGCQPAGSASGCGGFPSFPRSLSLQSDSRSSARCRSAHSPRPGPRQSGIVWFEMRLLLLADTHVPVRARDLPDEVWRVVVGADTVIHAGDVLHNLPATA